MPDEERRILVDELRNLRPAYNLPPVVVCEDAANEIERLERALRPFAELIHRRWENMDEAILTVETGGHVSELQAISLGDVIKASKVLGINANGK